MFETVFPERFQFTLSVSVMTRSPENLPERVMPLERAKQDISRDAAYIWSSVQLVSMYML